MPLILQRLLPRAPFFGASHASSTSQPSAQGLHPAWVVLWISVWMAAVCNVPLWREVLHLPGNTGVRGWAFLAAFMVLVTAGNAALLSLLAWRWTLKPAAGLLVLMAAFGAYFMLAYGIAIDASMLTNVLQTDVKEAGDLLNWQLPLTVGALAVQHDQAGTGRVGGLHLDAFKAHGGSGCNARRCRQTAAATRPVRRRRP